MKLVFGCDHAGLKLKNSLMEYAKQNGHEVQDMGCFTEESVDYPDYAAPVCGAVLQNKADRGVLICHTGIGFCMAANKIGGVRCALCGDPLSARLTREHNDSNVLALGAGMIGEALAKEIMTIWLSTPFFGGRHKTRVDKLMGIENR